MKISVMGSGYVGLVTGACLADLGHEVVCMDKDQARVELLQQGGCPIHEPGLSEMLIRNHREGRLVFSSSMQHAVEHGMVLFIAVGTPPNEDGSADVSHVLRVAESIGNCMQESKVVVNKSTVPVGTGARVERMIRDQLRSRGLDELGFSVVSNPEFLKEGSAVDDFMRPDRIVIGLDDTGDSEAARSLLSHVYANFNRHHERTVWMDVKSAELTKYAANAMLATRISFMNEMANLADLVGADIDDIRRGIGSDTRIGHSFLYAGTGYGGSCFPKDTRALCQTAMDHGTQMRLVASAERVNQRQKTVLLDRIDDVYGEQLKGRRFAVWGLAFKPNTDDMREAPSLDIIKGLLLRGATVHAHDPVAMPNAREALKQDLGTQQRLLRRMHWQDEAMTCLDEADALLIITEWKCYRNPCFDTLKQRMRRALVLDGRNLYDPELLQRFGIAYQGIGRRNPLALRLRGQVAHLHKTFSA
jgi:UDPglucose 6-dehydrogenase